MGAQKLQHPARTDKKEAAGVDEIAMTQVEFPSRRRVSAVKVLAEAALKSGS